MKQIQWWNDKTEKLVLWINGETNSMVQWWKYNNGKIMETQFNSEMVKQYQWCNVKIYLPLPGYYDAHPIYVLSITSNWVWEKLYYHTLVFNLCFFSSSSTSYFKITTMDTYYLYYLLVSVLIFEYISLFVVLLGLIFWFNFDQAFFLKDYPIFVFVFDFNQYYIYPFLLFILL